MQRLASILSFAALATAASAQFSIVIPNGMAAAEGSSSNAFPWGRGGAGIRIQTIYDSTNFTAQGVTFPVIITGLRWRPNTAVGLSASSYPDLNNTVKLSTCPVDQGGVTATFANQVGADETTCFSGPVSWAAQPAQAGPTPFGISVPFTTNFAYDPNLGDLNIECEMPIQAFTGAGPQLDVHATAPLASRVFLTAGYTPGGPTATAFTLNHGVVVEVSYTPAAGLYSGFTANVTAGASPLAVNFTDATYTSDPGGITSWAWDLDGDSVIDSTVQNPSFVYTGCGDYNVTLTTTDASHSPSTLVRTAYIKTDNVTPSFTFATLAPGVIQFTDTSTPVPTSWAWDLNGDNVVDSTSQNPVWFYPGVCSAATVTLTVNRNCRGPFSTARSLVLSPNTFTTTMVGGNGLSGVGSGNSFDINVTNPAGVVICALQLAPYMGAPVLGTPLGCTVWLTDAAGGYLPNHTNAAVWRQVATGTGNFAGGTFTAPVPTVMNLSSPIYLPFGTYGMGVYMTTGSGIAYTTQTAPVTYTGPDFSITSGIGKGSAFAATGNANRGWNAIISYSTAANGAQAGYGYFGAGCAGSLGISRLSNSSQPAVGTTLSVTMNNLPLSAVIMLTGFSNTTSAFGPLPLDITSFGAPGCKARVSPDATLFLFGASNTATWNFGIPNDPGLISLQMYNQAFVIDPAFNALGAVLSDAAAMIIGN